MKWLVQALRWGFLNGNFRWLAAQKTGLQLAHFCDKKHYVQIFKIIKENNATYSQNINGVFINLINIEEDILDKIVKYLNYIDSRNSEIDSEFYSKIVT